MVPHFREEEDGCSEEAKSSMCEWRERVREREKEAE